VLVVLVLACLASLMTGTETTLVQDGVRRVVSATAYPFLSVKRGMERGTDRALDVVFNFTRIQQEQDALRSEVARLKAEVAKRAEVGIENRRLREMLAFVREEARLTLEPVRVLQNAEGMLWVDRGHRHGIVPSMSVITRDGVVGIVVQVDDFSASVATIHHRDCKVGAMVLRNRLRAYDGVIHPSGNDLSRVCTMEYIDLKDDVRIGDLVVTSPESLFPAGIVIGRVTNVSGSGTLWRSAEIQPAVDVYRLDEVFVVRRAVPSPEEVAGPPVALAARAAEPPESETLQERYAP
jgi:rod shape-determining protein MreC